MMSLAKYVAMGAILGGGFWVGSNVAEQNGFVALDPKPRAFDIDPNSYRIFSKLHQMRKRHGVVVQEVDDLYVQLLLQTDKLLWLEKQLQTGRATPDYEDGFFATSYADDARQTMVKFLSLLEGRRREIADQCCDDLHQLLKAHTRNVMAMSEEAALGEDNTESDMSDY